MAEYINREAVLDKRRKVTEYDEAGFAMNYQAVPVEDVEAIPAADVVEVVRCKERKHATFYECKKMILVIVCGFVNTKSVLVSKTSFAVTEKGKAV